MEKRKIQSDQGRLGGNKAVQEGKKGISIGGLAIKTDYLLGLGLALFLIAYIYLKQVVFGVISLIFLLVLFLKDALPQKADSKGIKSAIFELGFALVAALAVWYGLGFLLQTPTPIDVVTSCSMLPNLDRGDLIILQGGEIRAAEVKLSKQVEFADFVKSDCIVREISTGKERREICTTGLRVDGKKYPFDHSGDIVVYEPQSAYRDLGLVVHRAALKLTFNGQTNYLIKGDNNPAPDVFGITQNFAKKEQIKGKVILRIPIIGYLKLFLSLQFDEPANCKYIVEQ